MKTYCVRQKKKTECVAGTETVKIAKNGRQMLVCECAECGATKTQFMAIDKKRMNLISDRIKHNADIKKMMTDVAARKSKMSDAEKKIIKNRVELLNKKKREITSELQNLEVILNRKLPEKLVMPDMSSDIMNWSPDLDNKYQKLVNENLNMRFNQLAIKPKEQTRKPKSVAKKRQIRKPEMPDLTKFNLRPDIDEKYNKIMESWNQMIKPKPKPAARKKKSSDSLKKYGMENWSDLSPEEVDRRINKYNAARKVNDFQPLSTPEIDAFIDKLNTIPEGSSIKRKNVIIRNEAGIFVIYLPYKGRLEYIGTGSNKSIANRLFMLDNGFFVLHKGFPETIMGLRAKYGKK